MFRVDANFGFRERLAESKEDLQASQRLHEMVDAVSVSVPQCDSWIEQLKKRESLEEADAPASPAAAAAARGEAQDRSMLANDAAAATSYGTATRDDGAAL